MHTDKDRHAAMLQNQSLTAQRNILREQFSEYTRRIQNLMANADADSLRRAAVLLGICEGHAMRIAEINERMRENAKNLAKVMNS